MQFNFGTRIYEVNEPNVLADRPKFIFWSGSRMSNMAALISEAFSEIRIVNTDLGVDYYSVISFDTAFTGTNPNVNYHIVIIAQNIIDYPIISATLPNTTRN